MDTNPKQRRSATKLVAVTAMALGLAAGSYGIASAATGTSPSTTASSTSTATALPTVGRQSSTSPSDQQPWGGQRSDETLLTGDTATKVEAAAVAKLSGGTVVRVETDADGNAAYEVHMVKADGTPATVYVDKQFAVVSVEQR